MNELSKKIMSELKPRSFKKQKEEFIEHLTNKYECTFQQNKSGSIRNVVIGDINTAKVIYTTNYDTPKFTQTNSSPFSENKLLFGLNVSTKVFIILFILFIPFYIYTMRGNYSMYTWMIGFVPLLIISDHQAKYITNTSGVVALIELIDRMSEEEKKNCAFVFFDCKEYYRTGSKAFYKEYKEQLENKFVINLDGVGYGENILLTYKKENQEEIEKLNHYFDNSDDFNLIKKEKFRRYYSDHLSFKKSVCVSTASHMKFFGNFINKNTKMCKMTEEHFDKIVSVLHEYHKGLNDN